MAYLPRRGNRVDKMDRPSLLSVCRAVLATQEGLRENCRSVWISENVDVEGAMEEAILVQ